MTLLETMKEGYWEVVVDNLNKGKVQIFLLISSQFRINSLKFSLQKKELMISLQIPLSK